VKIWKYQFGAPSMVCQIPKGAEVLCVQVQAGKACLWAIVDAFAPLEKRVFQIYETGSEIPSGKYNYIGTFQTCEEPTRLVAWHVFEVLNGH
jgi:hypothetical protein